LAAGGGTDAFNGLMTNKGHDATMKTFVWRIAPEGEYAQQIGTIRFHDVVHAMAFSPSGRLLAVGGENSQISLLLPENNFFSGCELVCPAGVRALAWNPSCGRFLASAGEDCQVSIWDVLAERAVFQLPKQQDWLTSLAFNASVTLLACAGFSCCSATVYQIDLFDRETVAATKELAQAQMAEPVAAPAPRSTSKTLETGPRKAHLKSAGTTHRLAIDDDDDDDADSSPQPLTLSFANIKVDPEDDAREVDPEDGAGEVRQTDSIKVQEGS